jgi:competence protein ComEA
MASINHEKGGLGAGLSTPSKGRRRTWQSHMKEESMRSIAVAVLLFAFAIPPVADAAPAANSASAADAKPSASRKVDVNRATAAELVSVPGIGQRLAEAIIQLRESKGPFTKLDDLLEIRGIGEKNLAYLAEYLTVAQQPPAPGAPVASQAK